MDLRRTTSTRNLKILQPDGYSEVKLYAATFSPGDGRPFYYGGRHFPADTTIRFTFSEFWQRVDERVIDERLHAGPLCYVRSYCILNGADERVELVEDVYDRLGVVADGFTESALRHIQAALWCFLNEAVYMAQSLGHRRIDVSLTLELITMVRYFAGVAPQGAPAEAALPQEEARGCAGGAPQWGPREAPLPQEEGRGCAGAAPQGVPVEAAMTQEVRGCAGGAPQGDPAEAPQEEEVRSSRSA